MDVKRLLTVKQIEHLCFIGTIQRAEALQTNKGWRVLFHVGDSRAFSVVCIEAARGGERFYQSLDSLYQLLLKLGCKHLDITVKQSVGDIGLKFNSKAAYRREPAQERLYFLKDKQRQYNDLSKDEINEMHFLEPQFSVFNP